PFVVPDEELSNGRERFFHATDAYGVSLAQLFGSRVCVGEPIHFRAELRKGAYDEIHLALSLFVSHFLTPLTPSFSLSFKAS
ncbi:MAG: hypothetical protein WKF30_09430, partial [Pyrinomonadaceae bacterium]